MDATLIDYRRERGMRLAQAAHLKQLLPGTWLVPSQTQSSGGYVVDVDRGTCSCPDHELRGDAVTCKHRWAVKFARHQVANADGTKIEISTMRVTYRQDWPSYNAAQCEEKDRVMVLLRELCDNVPNERQVGRGRRKAALSDVIFAAVMKTFVGLSGRRSTSDVRACAEKGFLDRPIAYNTIFDYLERPEMTPILKGLVRRAALPLAVVETKFAIDGTGFGSKVYKRWYDAKYGREMREATWVKLHAICGVETNVITAVEVTDATLNDSPLLPQLVRETAENFTVEEVMGDKAYLGHQNLEAIAAVGATPYVAFKTNSQESTKPRKIWNKAFHMFQFHREEWLAHYHKRSRIESTFSSIKRVYGPAVRAKAPDAMVNEVLLKCLAHNLSRLVHAIHELGLEPKLLGRSEAS